jgi:hypothetical protein
MNKERQMPILPPPPVALYGDLARARQIASSWKILDRLAEADADIVARAIAQGIAEGRRHGLQLAGTSFVKPSPAPAIAPSSLARGT